METIRQTTKQTIIIVVILIAIIIAITLIIQLASSNMHNEPERLYSFASTAKNFHEKIDNTDLIDNIPTLAEYFTKESPMNPSEIESSIQQGILSAKGYKDQFNWLRPTNEILYLYEALLEEASLIQKCYSRLYSAWSEQQVGNEPKCSQYLQEVTEAYNELVYLREQNTLELNNLLLQLE